MKEEAVNDFLCWIEMMKWLAVVISSLFLDNFSLLFASHTLREGNIQHFVTCHDIFDVFSKPIHSILRWSSVQIWAKGKEMPKPEEISEKLASDIHLVFSRSFLSSESFCHNHQLPAISNSIYLATCPCICDSNMNFAIEFKYVSKPIYLWRKYYYAWTDMCLIYAAMAT